MSGAIVDGRGGRSGLALGARAILGLACFAAALGAAPSTGWACFQDYLNQSRTYVGEGRPDDAGDPIVVWGGSVVVTDTDLSLPGVTGAWTQTRQYSSTLAGGTYIFGKGWVGGWLTAFFRQTGDTTLVLYLDHVTKHTFTLDNGTWVPPDDLPVTLTHNENTHRYYLTYIHTGEKLTFYDWSENYEDAQKGLLESRTDRYGQETITYNYSSDMNRIDSITTTQGWAVVYSYVSSGVNAGMVQQIDVYDGNPGSGAHVLERAKYSYYASNQGYASDCGSDGDLIMVQVLKRATTDNLSQTGDAAFSIKRTTMYRYCYYYGSPYDHHIKMILSPASVEKAMSDGSIETEAQLLALGDTGIVVGSTTLQDYANATYTYSGGDYPTTSIGPADGGVGGTGENLQTKYGGFNCNETGFVRTQTIRKDFKGNLNTRTFFYLSNSSPGANPNAVTRIVVEDHTTTWVPSPAARTGTRKIYGVNKDRRILREISIDNPQSSPKYWCSSFILGETKDGTTNNVNQVVEKREPSAHSCINSTSRVATFLDAEDDDDWTDTNILNASSGVIYTYAYDAEEHLVKERVKNGRTGDAYYLRVVAYGTGDDNEPTYLPLTIYTYPKATTTEADETRLATTFAYEFYDTEKPEQQLKTRTTTRPVVDDEGENGSGVAVVTEEYYDDRGRLRWTKDGEGYVNYYSYHPYTGGLGYAMVDVKTSQLDADITSGSSGKWVAWSGAAPFSRTGPAGTPLQLESKYEYDSLARRIKAQDPMGMLTCTAYGDNMTRVYPGWSTTSHTAALPIRVEKVNDDDLTLEMYTVDPAGVTEGCNQTTGLPTGSDTGQTQADFLTWTRYGYNATSTLLETVDQYHKIPNSGEGTLSTNFHRTFYRYDTRGRRYRTIEVVSGTSPEAGGNGVEQVTAVDYGARDRVIGVRRGVSGSGADMGATYATDPTLKQVSATFYDETTPGSGTSGVGDGLTTSTLAYYDADHIDADHAVKTIYHRDWRGRLRGIEPEDPPYTVQDIDNLGRVTAIAQFEGTDNFGSGWATVLGDEDYAENATDSKRRTLATTSYDAMGRVYRTETYAVNTSGVAGDRVVADTYYDRNSRVAAVTSPAKGGAEFFYDGAGRRIEVRAVRALQATKYAGGAFQYCDPQPEATSGGNEGVIEVVRTVYDKVGHPTRVIDLEANHDDADGLALTETEQDYVQTAVYSWYDASTQYLMTTAYYGSGGDAWAYAAAPAYATYSRRPTASSGSCLVTAYTYAKGRLETVADPRGLKTKLFYDALGRRLYVAENWDNFAFDGTTASNVGDGSDASIDRVTRYVYDGLSQVTEQTALDANAQNNQTTVYTYYNATRSPCSAELLTQVKYPDGDDTDDNVQMAYHLDGQVYTRTAQKLAGQESRPTITFLYDDTFHRLTEQHVAANGVDTAVQSVKTTYDALGRRDKVTTYDDDDCTGNVVNEVQYVYNNFGGLDREYQEHAGAVDADSLFVRYDYDTTSGTYNGLEDVYTKGLRPKSIQYPATGTPGEETVRYGSEVAPRKTYFLYTDASASSPYESPGLGDAISRTTAIASADGRGEDDVNVLAAYAYNGLARAVVEDFGVTTGGVTKPSLRLDRWGQTVRTYTGFDRFGRIVDQWWRYYGGTPADRDRYAYGYDYDSNRLWRQNQVALAASQKFDEQYLYDGLDRLKEFRRGVLDGNHTIPTANEQRVRTEAWGLAPTGTWDAYQVDADGDGDFTAADDLDQTRDHNVANEIEEVDEQDDPQQAEWDDPAYDARGNMTGVPKPSDPATSYTCAYDAWNRLVEVKDGETLVARYTYDGLGRRVKVATPSGATTTYRHFFYTAAWQVLETRTTTSAGAGPETLPPLYQFVWSLRYIDSPVLRDKNTDADDDCTDSEGSERLYYATDANQNVTALVNASGTVVERYAYDAYGQVTFLEEGWSKTQLDEETPGTLSAYDNAILFAGYWRDAETGLYHVRNRVYHAHLGWLQRDPLGYVDGMSLYEYVGSNPVGLVDPDGLNPLVAAAAGGEIVVITIEVGAIVITVAIVVDFGLTLTNEPYREAKARVIVRVLERGKETIDDIVKWAKKAIKRINIRKGPRGGPKSDPTLRRPPTPRPEQRPEDPIPGDRGPMRNPSRPWETYPNDTPDLEPLFPNPPHLGGALPGMEPPAARIPPRLGASPGAVGPEDVGGYSISGDWIGEGPRGPEGPEGSRQVPLTAKVKPSEDVRDVLIPLGLER